MVTVSEKVGVSPYRGVLEDGVYFRAVFYAPLSIRKEAKPLERCSDEEFPKKPSIFSKQVNTEMDSKQNNINSSNINSNGGENTIFSSSNSSKSSKLSSSDVVSSNKLMQSKFVADDLKRSYFTANVKGFEVVLDYSFDNILRSSVLMRDGTEYSLRLLRKANEEYVVATPLRAVKSSVKEVFYCKRSQFENFLSDTD